jgi:hypothetical protein
VSSDIPSDLTRLAEPEPPSTFSRSVMASVSRLAEERRPACQAGAFTAPGPRTSPVRNWTGLASRIAGVAGLVVVSVSWTYGTLAGGGWPGLVPSRPWLAAPLKMPLGGPAAVGLALGLLLYTTGLFAPLRNRARLHRRSTEAHLR